MKKIIIASVAVAALFTSVQADFSFADMFKDMKEAAFTLNKDSQDTPAKDSTSKNNTDTAVSTDTQNTAASSNTITSK